MSLIRIPRALPFAASVLALVPSASLSAQVPPRYRAEFLGEAINASDMNHAGAVVGSESIVGNVRGWVARHGQPLAPLPLPPGRLSSWANGINEQGVIVGAVGASFSPQFSGVAAVWTPNGSGGYAIQELGLLPGHVSSNATALNNVGDIVGWSSNGTFRTPVLFNPGGAPQSLAATGVFDPQSINDARMLVDSSADGKLLDLGTMQVQSMGVPQGQGVNYNSVWAYSINAFGQVAGLAILATGTSCDRQAARFTNGVGWEIFSGCGSSNSAYDLNDLGDLVMRLNVAPYVRLSGLGSFLIEELIDAPVGHWAVINGFGLAINNARQLVVPASNPTTGQSGLVLLTPATPVGTPVCPGDGSGLACPCANDGAPGNGCANSIFGAGANLSATGQASVLAEDLLLSASGLTGSAVVFFQGAAQAPDVVIDDGIGCVGGTILRLGTEPVAASTSAYPQPGDPLISVRGAIPPFGGTYVYQCFYRNAAAAFCPPATSNRTNGIALTWMP